MSRLDLSIAFDDAAYLTPQIYLYVQSLKDKIPEDSILHVTTTRSGNDILKYISKNIKSKIYIKPPITELKSRCSYLLRTMEIESDADYVLKTDLDILFLRGFDEALDLIKTDADIYIQSENRRIISDEKIETRLWKAMYKEMGFELPDILVPYMEKHELGRPLLNSGAFLIKTSKMRNLQEKWIELTRLTEKFITYNVHPNEQALTAIILCNHWKWIGLSGWLHFNPISHYRKGEFPSQELIDDCRLPEEVFMLHWHRWPWLKQLMVVNQNVYSIVKKCEQFIPDNVWDMSPSFFQERC